MRSKAQINSHPIHPMLVALPIGLWIGGFVFDLIAATTRREPFSTAAFYCIVAGCIAAVLAAIPGAIDLWTVVPRNSSARSRGLVHGSLNTAVLAIFVFEAIRRGSPVAFADNISLFCSFLAIIGLGISGWLGGTLVYRNQIGIDRRYANARQLKERTVEDFSRPVCNQSELGDGQMMLIRVGSERIAVGRCSEGIIAFSDSCSHRGGPLSDGALIGCTVQCPWHGSQFDCRTGRVVAGPADDSIQIYEIEIMAGDVYLRNPNPRDLKKAA